MEDFPLADLRRNYALAALDEGSVHPDPLQQFKDWFRNAMDAQLPEPNAMLLSTISDGRPHGRIVLLKGLDSRGFTWFTNYGSHKGGQLEVNPVAALTFFWQGLERQVRIEGAVEKVSPEESDAYFATRPRDSQIGAWASPQSKEVAREELDELFGKYEKRFAGQTVPRPPHWGGYVLMADVVEFWQGRPSRMHDRIVYYKRPEGWQIKRLAP